MPIEAIARRSNATKISVVCLAYQVWLTHPLSKNPNMVVLSNFILGILTGIQGFLSTCPGIRPLQVGKHAHNLLYYYTSSGIKQPSFNFEAHGGLKFGKLTYKQIYIWPKGIAWE